MRCWIVFPSWERVIFAHRLKIASPFGFDVWIDASWLLLAALLIWTLGDSIFPAMAPSLAPSTYWTMAVAATIGLLFSIVFHEMSHSLVARRYGMAIRGITLFIFGGVAEMESEPPSAKAELAMAAAGPAASLLLAILFFLLAGFFAQGSEPNAIQATFGYLSYANGMLALFNLVPAFPLDGGRILRAFLWGRRGDLTSATRTAAGVGGGFGVALIVLGVFEIISGQFVGGMWSFLIGFFLRDAAAASYRQVVTRAALEGVKVGRFMTRDPIAVPPGITVDGLIEDFVYRFHHRSFPVVRDGALIGQAGTEQAVTVERSDWATTRVEGIMAPVGTDEVIDADADALAALARMQRHGRRRLWVVENGRLVGVLSLSDLLALLTAKLELDGTGSRHHRLGHR